MTYGKHLLLWIALPLLLSSGLRSYAQSGESDPSSLSEEQKAARSKAEKDFAESKWSDAFAEFKALHEELPGNATIT